MDYKKALTRLWAKLVTSYIAYRERSECAGADVYDVPDPRDFPAPKARGAELPDEFDLGDKVAPFLLKYAGQSQSSCSGNSEIYQQEILNTIWNNELVQLDDRIQWIHQLDTGAKEPGGDTLQNAQKQFFNHPQGFPNGGYFRLRSTGDELIREMKLWMYSHFCPIHTGAKWRDNSSQENMLMTTNNYSFAKKTGEYLPWVGGKVVGAHAWIVRGWTKTHWIIKESLLNQYGDREELGTLLVAFENTEEMFSKYIVKDLRDE